MGLLTQPGQVIVAAKHPKQRAAARLAGADEVVLPAHTAKAVRRVSSAVKLTPERGQDFLLGGADVAIECVGSRSGLDLALRTVRGRRPRGRERHPRRRRRPHAAVVPRARARRRLHLRHGDHARRIARHGRSIWRSSAAGNLPVLEQLVGATYPLDRWREAIDHAMSAGKLGTFKVAFAPQG